MHILLTDDSNGVEQAVAALLEEAGHTVHSCHDGTHPGCAGLRGNRCPLDTAPVDLVVGAGTRARERASLRHEGILCGARRRLPLMFVGVPPEDLLPPWVPMRTVRSVRELPEAVGQVARTPLPVHSALATETLREALGRQGIKSRNATATVRRSEGGLQVEVDAPSACNERQREALAVDLHAAMRDLDPWASTCDIHFASPPAGVRSGT
jgi:CheY-like chemotaxis protein